MDLITSMIYESDFKATLKYRIEKVCKGTAHAFLDKQNDRFVISIITDGCKFTYYEYDLTEKLFNGMSAYELAGRFVWAYEKKIFKKFFK